MSVNYHGLSEFRVGHPDLLDRLLNENVATLSMAGVVDLDEVVQDAVCVRAAAGASSFHRKKKLHKELRKAERLIGRLKVEADDDPDASSRRNSERPRNRQHASWRSVGGTAPQDGVRY